MPSTTPSPLHDILESFVLFNKQAQELEEQQIKQEVKLQQQIRALQEEEGKKVHELEIQLSDALRVNTETQQELQAALLENLKNVARAQMDLDFVDLHTRVLRRQREDLRQKNQVLEAELDASIYCFHVTNKEYHHYEDLSKALQAENEVRAKELMELEAQLTALKKEKEKPISRSGNDTIKS